MTATPRPSRPPTSPGVLRAARGLALACHPGPTVAVTFVVVATAAAVGRSGWGLVLVALATVVGQLSIGWANDALDAPADVVAGRRDKPVATGAASRRTVAVAAAVALVASVPLALLAAGAAGWWYLLTVASGWAYDLGLKATPFSPVPYAVGFGALPGFVWGGLDPPLPTPAWAVAAVALTAVGAHFANALPDIDADRRTGREGLPARVGAGWSRAVAAAAVLAATAVLALGPGRDSPAAAAVLAAGVVVVAAGALWRHGRWLFEVVLVLACADVVLLVVLAG